MQKRVAVLVILLSLIPFSGGARAAEKMGKITEQAIHDFVQETSSITSGAAGLTLDEIGAYLATHIAEDARFTSTVKYNMPGFPAQDSALDLGKADFIDSILKGVGAMADYRQEVVAEDIKIDSGGKAASFRTRGVESGMIQMEGAPVPVEGASSCQQTATLGEDGMLKMQSAVCSTEIRFKRGAR